MDETMSYSYKKLWKLLIDKDLKKKDLAAIAGISQYTVTKMSKGENVNLDSLAKVCQALDCGLDDIVEIVSNENI